MTRSRLPRVLGVAALLALLWPVLCEAQTRALRFGHLSVEDGLSHTWVRSILKDSRGFLWVGTVAGLNRYDGSRFTTYHHDPKDPASLAGETVTALFEDSHKRLWVGAGGLDLYDRDRDRFDLRQLQRAANAPGALSVRSICEDHQGRLWIGTEEGLFRYDPETKTSKLYVHIPGQSGSLPYNVVAGLLCDSRGRVWVGSDGLDRYDERTDAFVHVLEGPEGPREKRREPTIGALYAHTFYEAPDGALWVGTLDDGLIRVNPETGAAKHYRFDPADPNGLGGNRISAVTGDRAAAIYVGVENQGLDVLDTRTGKFAHHRPDPDDPSSLASASIWNMLFDDQGILWFGTYNAGVQFVSPFAQLFGLVKARRGELSNPHVMAVIEDHVGNLWIGTDGGGLNHLDRKTGRFTYYRHNPSDPHSLGSDAVLALFEDRQQNIWIGTWGGGLHRLDPRTGRIERFSRGTDLPASLAEWTITEDAQGNLLLGRYATGVELFEPKTGKFTLFSRAYPGVFQPDPSHEASVYVLIEDAQGRLWAGGTEGIDVVDRKSGHVTRYPIEPANPQALVPGTVFAIRPDSRGNIWIGTESGGLTCLEANSQKVRRYTQADGLPHKGVGDIIEDREGNLWLGTPRGLVKFEKGVSLPEQPRFVVFDAHDGLQGYEFRHGASFKSSQGEMFFGGERGLSFFLPEVVRQNPMVPPVVLTDLRIFSKSVGIGTPGSPLKKAITETSELTLSYRQSVVTFEFAALNFILPEKNHYKYKLEGFDKDWNEVGTQRTATYTNLPQGRYTLRVRGSNNDGVWNDQGASLKIRVTPPFWWAWWFWTLMGLLLTAGLVSGFRLRVRAVEARRRELEATVRERTTDLEHEIGEHKLTETKLVDENEQRRRAEEEARQYVEKLAESNVELLANQEALTRENAERRRAEEEAGWERDLLRALMDNIPDLIVFKDAESRFVRVNAAHAKALGAASPAAVVGRSDADFFPAEFARATLADERELIRTGRAILDKVERDARRGRWYLATKVPIRGAGGAVTGLVGISKDITERKQVEENLTAELAAFREVVSSAARGDLTRRATESDETVGQVARLVNEMLTGFSSILTEVRATALSVSSSSSEILSASSEIAKGAQYGNEQLQSTSSAVEEMAASMTQVSRNADASAEKARQVLEHVRQGDRSVEAAFQGMTRIDAAVSQTADKMKLLEQRTNEVFEIIGLIEEIASRSTLLSLNAAIEAAHAGDAGRGFSVVAEEVRKLADRSGEATKNVAAIVKAIVEEVKDVLDAMQAAMREVKQGRTLSEQARGSLREVSPLVQDSVNLAAQISTASREQAQATTTVADAMQTISNISLESSAGANETSKAVHDLVRLSERLNEAISRFKIDGHFD